MRGRRFPLAGAEKKRMMPNRIRNRFWSLLYTESALPAFFIVFPPAVAGAVSGDIP